MYFTLHGNSVQNLPRRTPGVTNPRLPAPRGYLLNRHPWTSVQVGLRKYPEVVTQNTGVTTPRLPVPRGPFFDHLLPGLERRLECSFIDLGSLFVEIVPDDVD